MEVAGCGLGRRREPLVPWVFGRWRRWPATDGLGEARMVNRRWRLALAGSLPAAARATAPRPWRYVPSPLRRVGVVVFSLCVLCQARRLILERWGFFVLFMAGEAGVGWVIGVINVYNAVGHGAGLTKVRVAPVIGW